MATATRPAIQHHFTSDVLAYGIGRHIPSVRKIFASMSGDLVFVWTVIDRLDRSVCDSIYEVEEELMRTYADLKFDFNIIEGDADTAVDDANVIYERYAA